MPVCSSYTKWKIHQKCAQWPAEEKQGSAQSLNVRFSVRHLHILLAVSYIITSRIWNWLPAFLKNALDVASFRSLLNKQNFTGCQCNYSIWYFFLNWFLDCVRFFLFFSILNIQWFRDFSICIFNQPSIFQFIYLSIRANCF